MILPPANERRECFDGLLYACRLWLLGSVGTGNEMSFPRIPNWALFKQIAYFHNLEALLFRLIQNGAISDANIPDFCTREWEEAYYSNVIRNLDLFSFLGRFVNASENKNIPVIALKGPAAIALVYHDIGLRSMIDMDLLCQKKDLKALGDIAYALGCRRTGETCLHHVIFNLQASRASLEIHFDLYHFLPNRKLFLKSAWKNREWTSLDDIQIPVLSLEHQIVFDFIHIKAHRYEVSFKHSLDLVGKLLFQKDRINWKSLWSWLSLMNLNEEFRSFVSTLVRGLGIAAEWPDGLMKEEKAHPVQNQFWDHSLSLGFAGHPRVGSEFFQQRGVIKKSLFVSKILFPPLSAIQSCYHLSSPVIAALIAPFHAWQIFVDVWKSLPSVAGFLRKLLRPGSTGVKHEP